MYASSGLGRSTVHVLLVVPAVTGIATLFLPFTSNTSPMDAAIDKNLWWVADPFFLTMLITALSAHWRLSGSLSQVERALAYVVSAISAGVTLWFLALEGHGAVRETQGLIAMVASMATLLVGAFVVVRNVKRGVADALSPVTAMQVAYLANGIFCLTIFYGDWQKGAYYALVTAGMYLVQIAWAGRIAAR